MNLKRISEILASPMSDKQKEFTILDEMSKDKNVLIYILTMLSGERNRSKELISDMNLLLSKADTMIKHPSLNEDEFIQKEIAEFYRKNGQVSHCFKNK